MGHHPAGGCRKRLDAISFLASAVVVIVLRSNFD
jgi:hypothetical protein